MTPHPDEQVREFFSSRRFSCIQGNGTLSDRDIEALTALLARVRLTEAEWWADGSHPIINKGEPQFIEGCKQCQRIASLRQAAGDK